MKYFAVYIASLLVYLQQNSVVPSSNNDFGRNQVYFNDLNVHPTARGKYVFPKIYDFKQFKLSFKKDYFSMIENLSRKIIYMSKLFRVFVSSVKYKFRRLDYYFTINPMSDWSKKERHGIMLNQKSFDIPRAEELLTIEATTKKETRRKREVDVEREAQSFNEYELLLVPEIVDDKHDADYNDEQVSNTIDDFDNKTNRATSLGTNSKRSLPNYDWNARQDAKLSKQNPLSPIFQKTYAILSRLGSIKRCFSGDMIEVDHRSSNCFPPVKSQGRCGSCFIFTALSLYEWNYCQATGHRQEFSEQYVIDCGKRTGIDGCKGGAFFYLSKFVREFGIELSRNFPNSNSINQDCPYTQNARPYTMGYLRPKINRFFPIPLEDIKHHLRETPIGMYLQTNDEFFEYGGGIDSATDCSSQTIHSMLLVGSGREDGINYWLFRNSFSSEWGQNGYYKMSRKSVGCVHMGFGAALGVKFGPSLLSNINEEYDGLQAQTRGKQLDEMSAKQTIVK